MQGPGDANMETVSNKYPSLQDTWPQSDTSIELQGDVLEYILWLAHDRCHDFDVEVGQSLNRVMCDWYWSWWRFIGVLAGHWHLPPAEKDLPPCRNMAKLIALSTAATRLQVTNPGGLDNAFWHYARGTMLN